MNIKTKSFYKFNSQHGGMLMELLLTLALATIMLPFIFRFQQDRIERAKNIATEKQMEYVSVALEKYIDENKKSLLTTVGKNITRVKISDLQKYGLPEQILKEDKFQLRILKSKNNQDVANLQGLVILSNSEISPLRTRQIANIGGDKMGFIEQGKAFGAFGTWRTNAVNLDINSKRGLIKTTAKKSGNAQYLWRLPSDNPNDATMLSDLNLGKHNIVNTNFLNSDIARLDEVLFAKTSESENIIFDNRITIDNSFETLNATVAGDLSSDSKSLGIKNVLNLSDTGKFSNFEAKNLWVMDLNLSGMYVINSDTANILKVNKIIDMVSGNITAMYTTVTYTGSITPKLIVSGLITDSTNENYYWNVADKIANFYDIKFMELNRMSAEFIKSNPDNSTISGQLFTTVAANDNATVSDYINAINEMAAKVRVKYSQLNLE